MGSSTARPLSKRYRSLKRKAAQPTKTLPVKRYRTQKKSVQRQNTKQSEMPVPTAAMDLIRQNSDLLLLIFEHLDDGKDLLQAGHVCRLWRNSAESQHLWSNLCKKLWSDKVYVPEKFKKMKVEGRAKEAYFGSIKDSKRDWIRTDELCDFTWNFRFKKQAGTDWTDHDPWWNGRQATQLKFLRTGVIERVLVGDPVEESIPMFDLHWRFVQGTIYRRGVKGSFIQVNSYPVEVVFRHPSNWGFILDSCWTVWTSWKMPHKDVIKDVDPHVTDDCLRIGFEEQWAEALSYNNGLAAVMPTAVGDSDSESEGQDRAEQPEYVHVNLAIPNTDDENQLRRSQRIRARALREAIEEERALAGSNADGDEHETALLVLPDGSTVPFSAGNLIRIAHLVRSGSEEDEEEEWVQNDAEESSDDDNEEEDEDEEDEADEDADEETQTED
eukprot:Clim_evm5s152 gene=Clim_evmTU5s152